MNSSAIVRRRNPLSTLHKLAQPRIAAEVCEFCSLPLGHAHRHLLETSTRKLVCACDACALRFDNVVGRFKLIPRDTRSLGQLQLTDAQWESLSIPIGLAFFFRSTPAGKVMALYPSPGGATESALPIHSWESIVAQNPALLNMQPDVEALLANRLQERADYFLAPLDVCFELVGLLRLHWRGFSGGEKLWEQLNGFFCRLRDNAVPVTAQVMEAGHA